MCVCVCVCVCACACVCVCVKVIDLDDPEVEHGLQIISTSKSFRLRTRYTNNFSCDKYILEKYSLVLKRRRFSG